MRHGEAPHRVGDMARFGARLLEELEPRRRGEEEIAHFDARARRMGGGLGLALGAAVDRQAPGGVGPAGREVMVKRLTEAIDGRPRRGSPACGCRSRSSSGSLEVQCRSTASASSSRGHADCRHRPPTRKVRPPSFRVTAMRRAPASIAFSTSSLTALAGRSTTSPAAIWLTRFGGQAAQHRAASLRLPPLGKILAGEHLAVLDRGLVEGVDAPQLGREHGLEHIVTSTSRIRGGAALAGLPTTTVVIASSRRMRRATRRTSSALTAPISAARRSR